MSVYAISPKLRAQIEETMRLHAASDPFLRDWINHHEQMEARGLLTPAGRASLDKAREELRRCEVPCHLVGVWTGESSYAAHEPDMRFAFGVLAICLCVFVALCAVT